MDAWNERVHIHLDPSPSIGVALLAGHNWLQVYCPGCRQAKQVDLRDIDRHRGATIGSLIPHLSCRDCDGRGGAPFAKIKGTTICHLAPRWRRTLF
jgi:hypothetical protein